MKHKGGEKRRTMKFSGLILTDFERVHLLEGLQQFNRLLKFLFNRVSKNILESNGFFKFISPFKKSRMGTSLEGAITISDKGTGFQVNCVIKTKKSYTYILKKMSRVNTERRVINFLVQKDKNK